MPPRPISTYSDVAPIWARANELGYLRLDYHEERTAIYVNQRLNALRAKLRKVNGALALPGLEPSSPYDHLVVSRRGATLEIKPRPVIEAVMSDAAGQPVELAPAPVDTSLPAEVLEARRNLGLD